MDTFISNPKPKLYSTNIEMRCIIKNTKTPRAVIQNRILFKYDYDSNIVNIDMASWNGKIIDIYFNKQLCISNNNNIIWFT